MCAEGAEQRRLKGTERLRGPSLAVCVGCQMKPGLAGSGGGGGVWASVCQVHGTRGEVAWRLLLLVSSERLEGLQHAACSHQLRPSGQHLG